MRGEDAKGRIVISFAAFDIADYAQSLSKGISKGAYINSIPSFSIELAAPALALEVRPSKTSLACSEPD